MAWASLSTNTKAAVVFYSVYGAVFFIVRPARSLLLSFTWPLLLCVTHACCVLLAHLSCGHSRCCRLSTARPLCACRRRFSDGGGPGGCLPCACRSRSTSRACTAWGSCRSSRCSWSVSAGRSHGWCRPSSTCAHRQGPPTDCDNWFQARSSKRWNHSTHGPRSRPLSGSVISCRTLWTNDRFCLGILPCRPALTVNVCLPSRAHIARRGGSDPVRRRAATARHRASAGSSSTPNRAPQSVCCCQ